MFVRLRLAALKRELYPWLFNVTEDTVQKTIIDLGAAFRVFFTKQELTRI